MSRKRKGSTPRFAAEHGEGHCRAQRLCVECGSKLTGRRRRWCSDACVQAYLIRADPKEARRHVFKRDKGVCSRCDLDTEEVKRVVRRVTKTALAEWGRRNNRRRTVRFRPRSRRMPKSAIPIAEKARRAALTPFGLEKWWWRKTWWDADHIVAVADGGGECGIDNLRTLCVRCHEERSSRQRRVKPRRIPRLENETREEYRERVLGFVVPQGASSG